MENSGNASDTIKRRIAESNNLKTATGAESSCEPANNETFGPKVLNSDLPVLVDFWAPWCGPCRANAPAVEELAGEYAGRIKFVKINVDEGLRTAMSWEVRDLPTFILFSGGRPIHRQVGVRPKAAMRELIDQWLSERPPGDAVNA